MRITTMPVTKISNDDDLKSQIREELGKKPAKSTQRQRVEETKTQIRAQLQQQDLTPSPFKSREEEDEEMKLQIEVELRRAPPRSHQAPSDTELKCQIQEQIMESAARTQKEQDEETKRQQMQSELKLQPRSPPSPADRDTRIKGQIRDQMTVSNQSEVSSGLDVPGPNGSVMSEVNETPPDTQRSRWNRRRRRNQQAEADEAMKAQIRVNRNVERAAVGHATLEPDYEMGFNSCVGDTVNRLAVTSVPANAPVDAARVSPQSHTRTSSTEKGLPRDLPVGLRPGAFPARGRAYGALPQWARRSRRSRREVTENSNIPQELRGATFDDQESNVLAADVTYANTTATENKGARKKWISAITVLFLFVVAVAVAVGVTAGGDTVTLTISPTQSPTFFKECAGFESIGDPNIGNMDDDTFRQYRELIQRLSPRLLPAFMVPTNAGEYCSAAHLALVWLATDYLDINLSQKSLENRFLLALFYVEWDGYNWMNNTGWLSESSECDWSGISCDEFGENIVLSELDLGNQLKMNLDHAHTIPFEIGLLTDLRSLKLQGNSLSGTIPASLGNLEELEILDLMNNNLNGTFPLSNISSRLRTLRLSNNPDLEVNVPTTIDQWKELEFLELADTGGTGELPTEIGNMSNLAVLNMFKSGLSGQIPTEIGSMESLQYVILRENKLEGPLVTELGLLTNLKWLNLRNNALSGSLPTEIGNLSMLERLDVTKLSALTGPIPTDIGRCTLLERLVIAGTSINGTLPSELSLLSALKTVDLSESDLLEGMVPSSLLSLSSLEVFDIRDTSLYTSLSGAITVNITDLPSLTCLGLGRTNPQPTQTSGVLIGETCELSFAYDFNFKRCSSMNLANCSCCPDCLQSLRLWDCTSVVDSEDLAIQEQIVREFFEL
jgi:Leucine-rich repeat (LRR) protein